MQSQMATLAASLSSRASKPVPEPKGKDMTVHHNRKAQDRAAIQSQLQRTPEAVRRIG